MHRLPYPIAAQASSVPPRVLLLDASSQKPPGHRLPPRACVARPRIRSHFFPATVQCFQLSIWERGRCDISACTLLWLSASLLKILLSRHPFAHDRSRTLRFCSGTQSFGEIGSCEFLVVDLLGLVFAQQLWPATGLRRHC